jgi:hypothetical protein
MLTRHGSAPTLDTRRNAITKIATNGGFDDFNCEITAFLSGAAAKFAQAGWRGVTVQMCAGQHTDATDSVPHHSGLVPESSL